MVKLNLKPLHFFYDGGYNVRINRYILNCIDHDIRPAIYYPEMYDISTNKRASYWGFNKSEIDLASYPKNRYVSNMITAKHDPIGLKKIL